MRGNDPPFFFFFCKALKFSKSENSLRFSGVLKQIKIQLRSEVVFCVLQTVKIELRSLRISDARETLVTSKSRTKMKERLQKLKQNEKRRKKRRERERERERERKSQ